MSVSISEYDVWKIIVARVVQDVFGPDWTDTPEALRKVWRNCRYYAGTSIMCSFSKWSRKSFRTTGQFLSYIAMR